MGLNGTNSPHRNTSHRARTSVTRGFQGLFPPSAPPLIHPLIPHSPFPLVTPPVVIQEVRGGLISVPFSSLDSGLCSHAWTKNPRQGKVLLFFLIIFRGPFGYPQLASTVRGGRGRCWEDHSLSIEILQGSRTNVRLPIVGIPATLAAWSLQQCSVCLGRPLRLPTMTNAAPQATHSLE